MSQRNETPRTLAVGSSLLGSLLGLAVAVLLVALPVTALAAVNIEAGKECFANAAPASQVNANIPGDFIDCQTTVAYADQDGDINRVTQPAFDAMDAADLPLLTCSQHPIQLAARIVEVGDNAACSGGTCVPATGANCTLPCIICESGDTRQDQTTGLVCPGNIGAGSVSFAHNDVCQIDSCPAPEPTGPDAGFSVIDDESQIQIATTCAGENTNGQGGPDNAVCPTVFTANAQPTGKSFCETDCPEVTIDKVAECVLDDTATQICRFSWEVTNTSPDQTATNCVVTDEYSETDGQVIPPVVTPIGDLPPGEMVPGGSDQPLIPGLTNVATVRCNGHSDDSANECLPPSDTAVCSCGDDYKCYAVKETRRGTFEPPYVGLKDQFGYSHAKVLVPFELCNPVNKNGEGISDPYGHLMCYKLRSYAKRERRFVTDTDQFGEEDLLVGGPAELCLPAIKNEEGELSLEELEQVLNHYQCYQARGNPPIGPFQGVELVDQFEPDARFTDVNSTSLHCNPVSKYVRENNGGDKLESNGAPPDPLKHLKCYNITDQAGQLRPFAGERKIVTVQDQFGTRDYQAGRITRLCEEAEVTCDPTVLGRLGATCGTEAECECDDAFACYPNDPNGPPGSVGTCVVLEE